MFHRRSSGRPRLGRQSRRTRAVRAWMIAVVAGAAAIVVAYSAASSGSEGAADSADVYAVGTGTVPAGGWDHGGYPMMGGPGNGYGSGDGYGSTLDGTVNAAAMTSVNWSGYAAAGDPGTFTSVSSSWTQPAVTCGATNTFSSFWVGLDGDGTQTVEQTGTEADCSNGTAAYSGWWEMFPNAPVFYDNPVQPGDAMSASVVADGGGVFTLTLTDATQNWTQSTQQISQTAQLGSAEIIAEAPSSSTVLPLSDFGTVNFTNVAVDDAPLGNENPSALTMDSANGVTEATPSALTGGNSFSVTWDSDGGTGAPGGGETPSPGTSMVSPSPSTTATPTTGW
jgi:hypothetical protein